MFAFRRGRLRTWILGEAIAILVLVVASVIASRWTCWPELARRLDPYFAKAGLRPVRILF